MDGEFIDFTASPLACVLLSGAALAIAVWADLSIFRLLPDLIEAVSRRACIAALRMELERYPGRRSLRRELAELYVQSRQPVAAARVLKPNVAAGDHSVGTLYLMGVACFGAGFPEQAEVFLAEARHLDRDHRGGAIDLELARGRLLTGSQLRALEPLDDYLRSHPGSIEAQVLLAEALKAGRHPVESRRLCQDAWDAFRALPWHKRTGHRRWAYRARPRRALAYVAAATISGVILLSATAFSVGAKRSLDARGHRCPPKGVVSMGAVP